MKKFLLILSAFCVLGALLSGCYSTACSDGQNVYDKQVSYKDAK